ncbi:MAG: hypothetical protein FWE58_01285 [Methanobrevibacter sp.]|nr:hypothetical protein [Methanobrevibacter sp.]
MELHIIEMPKVRKLESYKKIKKYLKNKNKEENINISKELQYLIFLDNQTSHEERKEIVKMGDEGLNVALKKIEEALQDEDAYDIYMTQKIKELQQKTMMEDREEKGIKIGEEKGIKIGEEKGREEEKIKIAFKLKNMGLSIEEVAKATGLKLEFIKKLKT